MFSHDEDEDDSSEDQVDYQARYQKEFPEGYAALTSTADIDWRDEYKNTEKYNYLGIFEAQKKLIKAFKLLDLAECRNEITVYLESAAKQKNPPSLHGILFACDNGGANAPPLGIFQWLAAHRPDISKQLCEEIYEKIVLPYCNNNPNLLLEWSIRTGRSDEEIKRHIAAANDLAGMMVNIANALRTNKAYLADWIVAQFDVQTILKACSNYSSKDALQFLLDKTTPEFRATYFSEMCQLADTSRVAFLLEQGIKPGVSDWEAVCGASPIKQDHYKIVDLFMQHAQIIPASLINSSAIDESMKMYLQIKNGSLEKSEMEKVLIRACKNGDEKLAILLLEHGVSTAVVDQAGIPVLTHACHSGNSELVKTMVWAHGADVAPTLNQACRDGNLQIINTLKDCHVIGGNQDVAIEIDAAKLACLNGHVAIVDKLINKAIQGGGVKPETLMSSLCDPFEREGVLTLFNVVKSAPDRAMMIDEALSRNDPQLTSQLLDVIWSLPDDVSENGTGHYLYFAKSCHYGTPDNMARLQDKDATSQLRFALNYSPNAQVINYLLDQGADIAKCEGLIFAAVNTGDANLVQRLLKSGVDINARDFHDSTALMIASENGQTAMIRLLLNQGADVNAVNDKQFTAMGLMFSRHVFREHQVDDFFELIKLFLKNGANPEKILVKSKDWKDGLDVQVPKLFMDAMLDLIQDMRLREEVQANYKAFRKEVQKGSQAPDANPAQTFSAIKSLVNAINQGASYDELLQQRKDAATSVLASSIFDVDANFYNTARDNIARINVLEKLQHILVAADLRKSSVLTEIRDVIAHSENEYTEKVIDKIEQVLARRQAGQFQGFNLHAHMDPHENLLRDFIKLVKSNDLNTVDSSQKLDSLKASLGVETKQVTTQNSL